MPGSGAPLDRHVADRHPLLHRQRADRVAGVLDDIADAAVHADLADDAEDQVLRREAGRQRADELEQHRPRLGAAAGSASRGRARPPTCRSRRRARRTRRASTCGCRRRRSSCPGCVRPSSGPITWTIPSLPGSVRVERDAELRAVLARARRAAASPSDRSTGPVASSARCGPSSRRQLGPSHTAPGESKPLERLRRRDLVDEVEVDVEQRRLARLLRTTCWSQTFSNRVEPMFLKCIAGRGVYTPGTPAPGSVSPERRRTR